MGTVYSGKRHISVNYIIYEIQSARDGESVTYLISRSGEFLFSAKVGAGNKIQADYDLTGEQMAQIENRINKLRGWI